MKEQEKYDAIKDFVEHGGNKKRVAKRLGISERHVNRLIDIYNEVGENGFVHGNRTRKPINTLDPQTSEDIILLYKTKYQDFNFRHFTEYLNEEEGIKVSYACVYNILTSAGIYSPRIRKQTKRRIAKERLLKEKKLNNKTEEEIEIIVNHEVEIEDSHPRGEKPKYFGEIIEMDGSIHQWFGTTKCCLHLAADKATNTIVGAWFDNQETLNGYYRLFYQILTNYGIPYSFFTDNRTVFNYNMLNRDKKTAEKDVLTQFGYACKQLGVDLKTSSVSQSKGLIERDNGTFQGRLVNELRLNGINTIDKANEYLLNEFVPKFNRKFAMDYSKFESVFEVSPTPEKINYTLAVLSSRKIDNGSSIKYHNKYYQAYENNELKCFVPKTEALVIKAYDGDLLVSIDEKIYELKMLERNKKVSEQIDNIVEKNSSERKKYIPPMSHPWKAASFKKQMKLAHTRHVYA